MGILKLMDFIRSKFPAAISITRPPFYHKKVLAIDTSNWIYQFLIKTQTLQNGNLNIPTDEYGNQTGHLIGIMSRIQFCLQNKISPIWVFDGKPPPQKFDELKRRKELKETAEEAVETAREEGQAFDLLKMSQRTIRISDNQKNDAKKLITLAGFPVIQSPSEAEPQCASLVKQGLAYGVVSEDMDTLAFGSPVLIRHFHKKDECLEISLQKLLFDSELSHEQFVDLCILCGCDYTSKIKNIGPVRAYKMLREYGSIQNILEQIAKSEKLAEKHEVQENFNHLQARKIFLTPQILHLEKKDLESKEFQEQKLIQFLTEKDFSEKRIHNWLGRIKSASNFQ